MKKIVISIACICLLMTSYTIASAKTDGQPFKELWDFVNSLQEQIDQIEIAPGPQGPQGEPGPQGPAGEDGKDFQIPDPKTVIFAENRPQPFNSDWIDVSGGYNTISLTLEITGGITQYDIHFSNDKNNFGIQKTVNCEGKSVCPVVTIPILAKYYRISTGTSNGNITSLGYLIFN